jgi:hypothetical protein
MGRCRQVFLVEPTVEEDRPLIDFQFEENRSNNWLAIDQVLRGERPIEEYPAAHISVMHKAATEWDFYSVPGTFGLFSQRAVDLLAPYTSDNFDFLEARLCRLPFYFVKTRRLLDCLDRQRSVLVWFRSDPTRVKKIERHSFRKDLIEDPSLFSIPEQHGLFATQSVRTFIEQRRLKGFKFTDLERTIE